jgi:hypothetical protein
VAQIVKDSGRAIFLLAQNEFKSTQQLIVSDDVNDIRVFPLHNFKILQLS